MAYRDDKDLEFFKELDNSDLDTLVKLLTTDKDGGKLLTSELNSRVSYKKYNPTGQHIEYWDEIAAEIQTFGANTFVTIFRGGKGVLYKEVLIDVCNKMKVNFNKNSSTDVIENYLIQKVFLDSLDKMSDEQRMDFIKELGLKTTDFTSQAIMTALQVPLKMGGSMSYQIAAIVANSVAKAVLGAGLMFAANATITRTVGMFLGPIGWVVTGVWTAADIAGPAYRVTIPAVIQVACLRIKYNMMKSGDAHLL